VATHDRQPVEAEPLVRVRCRRAGTGAATPPRPVYGALVAGSERGQTIADNQAAFADIGLAPHVVGQQPKRKLGTTLLGHDISLPVIISPTGVQAVRPDGELAVARAAMLVATVVERAA
jgi:pre-mycofactocin synthase